MDAPAPIAIKLPRKGQNPPPARQAAHRPSTGHTVFSSTS